MEQTSINRLNQLHPLIREKALLAYKEAVNATPTGVHPFITQTFRTFAESDALYAQGRTKPGSVVTNAPAGSSYHNYALALDFVNLVNGKESWTVDKNWMAVVNIFKKYGFKWGGDWSSLKDYPHLEMSLGYSVKELKALHDAGKVDSEGYLIIKPK